MNKNCSNILDLPNELLYLIVKYLNVYDVVYSLIDIDERFAEMAVDPLYIASVDITAGRMKSSFSNCYSMDEKVVLRICERILPRIHDRINKLCLAQHSMERILFTLNYPQLFSLSLVNCQEETLLRYLKDQSTLRELLREQIRHLSIDIENAEPSIAFKLILLESKRLTHLNICRLFPHRTTSISIFELPYGSIWSSSLTQLKINVSTFTDCLCILDGRLPHLSKLIINVKEYSSRYFLSYMIKGKCPRLKCFSLSFSDYEEHYDAIVGLLDQMRHLEELTLFLLVMRVDSTYIDGIKLYNDILIDMPRLKKFSFSINTSIIRENIAELDFSSNEYIQSTFVGRGYGQVGSYIYSYPTRDCSRCHIYSLPYQFERFFDLNNSFLFQGQIFDKVQYLTMMDGHPFQHEFFQVTSHYFPFLKQLTIFNGEPQQHTQDSSTLITFSHLVYLNLSHAHTHYAEQLLLTKNTHLPCLSDLFIRYESLTILTNNFTIDRMCLNCTQLKQLHIKEPFVRPKTFHSYFPSF